MMCGVIQPGLLGFSACSGTAAHRLDFALGAYLHDGPERRQCEAEFDPQEVTLLSLKILL